MKFLLAIVLAATAIGGTMNVQQVHKAPDYTLLATTPAGGKVELLPGDKAPDFTAETTTGAHISLHQYRGKENVVLYFYPADLSKGCSIEACKFRDEHADFTKAHTVILGVSLQDRASHEKFTEEDKLNFPLLVDTNRALANKYGVPIAFGKYDARWTFLIGKDGKIIDTFHNVDPNTHSVQLLAAIWTYNKEHANNKAHAK
ncbi:MAG TPA: peroxiredoxin [Candidatus Kapabacteria bacterium]|nr:peroxiredoxin [Candidatus Kapabacteria bacterium]